MQEPQSLINKPFDFWENEAIFSRFWLILNTTHLACACVPVFEGFVAALGVGVPAAAV